MLWRRHLFAIETQQDVSRFDTCEGRGSATVDVSNIRRNRNNCLIEQGLVAVAHAQGSLAPDALRTAVKEPLSATYGA